MLFRSIRSIRTARVTVKNLSTAGINFLDYSEFLLDFPSAENIQIVFELIEILSTVIARMQVSCQVIFDILSEVNNPDDQYCNRNVQITE